MFAFFMLNALFVLIVFLLTLKKDNLHIKWPFGVKTNITYDESSQEVTKVGSLCSLDVISYLVKLTNNTQTHLNCASRY